MKVLTRLAFAWVTLLGTEAFAQYSTGFENPPFNSGTINGQDSWTSSSPDNARILTATQIADLLTAAGLTPGMTVHGGSQALLVSGAGGQSATIRQVSELQSETAILVDVWARPLVGGNTGAPTGNVFAVLEDAGGVRAATFRFGRPAAEGGGQSIDYATSNDANAFSWQPSGLSWDTDTWYRLTMTVDYTAKTYRLAVNGVPVTATPVPFYNRNSASFNQIRIFRGNNQAGMIVDDLSMGVVPEPALFPCVAAGAAALLLRRRLPRL